MFGVINVFPPLLTLYIQYNFMPYFCKPYTLKFRKYNLIPNNIMTCCITIDYFLGIYNVFTAHYMEQTCCGTG